MSKYTMLNAGLKGSARLSGEISSEASRRAGKRAEYQIDDQNRKNMWGTISQLYGIGSTLWGNYTANREIGEYAEGQGFAVKGSKFSKFFGEQKYEMDGHEFDRSYIMGLRNYEEYKNQKNLMNAVLGNEGGIY